MSTARLFTIVALLLTVGGTAVAAKFPDFTFKTDNGPLKLETLHGKIVYLDYWASWCAPCRRSFPWMNEIQARYRKQGLVIVAVSVDFNPSEARHFLAKHPANFRIAYDTGGETASALGLPGMPSAFLIDRDGGVVARHIGFREADKQKWEDEIRRQLAHGH